VTAALVARRPWTPLQRRTIATLRLAQVPGQAATASAVAVTALLAGDMLGSDRLAGTGSASFTLGSAIAMVPLSATMRRHGRRFGLVRAFGVGAVGAVVAAVGGQNGWFAVFVLGMVMFGAGPAAALQCRYAAADVADDDQRARAIAAVVWVGTLGAAFGPLLTPVEKDLAEAIGLRRDVGPIVVGAFLFAIAAVVVAMRLRPDPLEVAGLVDPHAERPRPLAQFRGAIGAVRASRGAPLGLAAMVTAHAAMVGVMTMTPPHMKDHGHSDLSAFVIALHIVGMYGFAPLVGRFVDRMGRPRAIQTGAAILGAGTVTTVLGGYHPVLVFLGLFLLGLGWNFCIIGGSALLTESVPGRSRVEVQGTADLLMSASGAVAAFGSGFVKQALGFHLLADAAAVAAMVLFAGALMQRRLRSVSVASSA
jgi:MFS family permease